MVSPAKSAAAGVLGRPPPAPSSSPPAPLLRGRASPLTLVSTGGGGLVSPMMGGGSRSSLGSLAEIPAPSSKPPSTYHDYSGSTQIQDIFLERFEGRKGRGDGRSRQPQPTSVLCPGSDQYDYERMDVWNYDGICGPCLIAQPASTREVASAVKAYTQGVRDALRVMKETGDTTLGVPRLCVAGGRTSASSFVDGAIVLDLSRLNGVSVAEDGTTVTVQGGTRGHALATELGKRGLMVSASLNAGCGVVGTVLGGGWGPACRMHGLACDGIVSAEVVLADGRLKRCTAERNEDLFWALRGGGGGLGVVTQLTLKCHRLSNAALLTYALSSPTARMRKRIVARWARWLAGDDDLPEAPPEVYSHLVLRTDWKRVSLLATSIDDGAVPQSEDYLEAFEDAATRRGRGSLARSASFLTTTSSTSSADLPVSWDRVPGLAALKRDRFGSRMRFGARFRMIRYCDELAALGDELFPPGNVYVAYRYAAAMSHEVSDILVGATMAGAPNNESRIIISSLGCATHRPPKAGTAFDARDAKFVIYIEGRWSESSSDERDGHERDRVRRWVNAVGTDLYRCDGVRSTMHPESARDQPGRSAKKAPPPPGWYTAGEETGARLAAIKKRQDQRNVFSLASRLSWAKSTSKAAAPWDEANRAAEATATGATMKSDSTSKHPAESTQSDDEDDHTIETTDDKFALTHSMEIMQQQWNPFDLSDQCSPVQEDSRNCSEADETSSQGSGEEGLGSKRIAKTLVDV